MDTVRLCYENAASKKMYAEKLKTLTASNSSDALIMAYHGASFAFLAKHHWNPYSKYSLVQDGLVYLNKAASAAPNDVEVRFVRFSIEENLPLIISFTSHVESDKNFVISNLNISHPYYATIRAYMLNSSNVSEDDKKKIR
ncbi:MAG: hypothetical protein H7321_09785 [Bacteroidia bacterium]|nr:hypothetical protein [Bacteroidia bacterium]